MLVLVCSNEPPSCINNFPPVPTVMVSSTVSVLSFGTVKVKFGLTVQEQTVRSELKVVLLLTRRLLPDSFPAPFV